MPPTLSPRSASAAPDSPLLEIDREACLRLEHALTREWLETDGCGGYASSTILMCPTRRYHGLLVTVPPGHRRRHLFLSRFEESLHAEGREFPLSMARYPGTWAPRGHRHLESFRLAPWPIFHYRIGLADFRREILLLRGRSIVLCRYTLGGERDGLELRLRPLLGFREADALSFENLDLDPRVEHLPNGFRCRPYPSLPPLTITVGVRGAVSQPFEADPVWYRRLEYRRDLARGYDGHEDQFSPGWFDLPLHLGGELVVAATLGEPLPDPLSVWEEESRQRRAALALGRAPGSTRTPWSTRARLELAAEQFLYRDPDGRRGIVAGFPWFGEWGRDSFLALPGLTLARGDRESCAEVLRGALPYFRDGQLPNIYGEGPRDSVYGAADPALCFARALRSWDLAGAPEEELLERFRPALESIAAAAIEGKGPLRLENGGLVEVGGPDRNCTWMDAQVDGIPVTPRHGQPVEIEALWYFLLAYLERLARRAGDRPAQRHWMARKRLAGRTFKERFWMPEEERLADRWVEGHAVPEIRPNMVIAAALEFSPLTRRQRSGVLRCARAELLTPRGLRTLSPQDPDYHGRYQGGPAERDRAYHQGTVWPWLLGSYCEALVRSLNPGKGHFAQLRELLEGFGESLDGHGLNQLSEVYDGDPPHRPGGCIAQAWSVGEVLRAFALLEEGS